MGVSRVFSLKQKQEFKFEICVLLLVLLKLFIHPSLSFFCRRRQWHPTPVLLPGKFHEWRSLDGYVHWVAEPRTRLSDFTFTFHFRALEKEMATHSSVLALRIPGTGEPGGLPSMGSHRVGHNWINLAAAAALNIIILKFIYIIMCINSSFFQSCWIEFHYMNISQLYCPLTCWWIFELYRVWGYKK